MKYIIADEIVRFDAEIESLERRFDYYLYQGEIDSNSEICLEFDKFYKFRKIHDHLSELQCELIFSLQIFFDKMIKKNKLLLHAGVVVIDGASYIFIGEAGCGKSYFLHRLMEYYPGSYIFSDDRTVIGIKDKKLWVWNTPWSKNGIKAFDGNSANYIFFIKNSNVFDVRKSNVDELATNIKDLYPEEYQDQVYDLLCKIIRKNSCFIIKNDQYSFDIEKLRCVEHEL